MVTVLIVMLVLTIGGLTLAVIATNTTGTVSGVRDRSAAQAEVDGAIATLSVDLREGRLECDTTRQKRDTLKNGLSPHSVNWTLDCAEEGLLGTATIMARANVNGEDVLREARFSYDLAPVDVPTYGSPNDPIMMFGDDGTTFNSNNLVFDRDNPVNVSIPRGSFTCNTRFPGSLTVKGNITVQGGCEVTGNMISVTGTINGPGLKVGGDVMAFGAITMSGNAMVQGNMYSHTGIVKMVGSDRIVGNVTAGGAAQSSLGHIGGNVHLAGGFTSNTSAFVIGGDVIAAGDAALRDGKFEGSVTIPTTVPNDKINVGWSATIKGQRANLNPLTPGFNRPGSVTAPTFPAMPVLSTWFEYKYTASDWSAYKTIELAASGSGSGSCTGFKTSMGAWLTAESQNTAQPLVIDARSCGELSTNYGSGADVKLSKNVVLLANSFDLTNMKVRAAAGVTEKPHLWILKSDDNPGDAAPTCSPTGNTKLNMSFFDTSIATMVYTPCTVQVNGASGLYGQLYGGKWAGGGGAGITFGPDDIGLPGMDSSGGSGGGGGSSSGTEVVDGSLRLQLSRDLPIPSAP